MNKRRRWLEILFFILISLCVNGGWMMANHPWTTLLYLPVFLFCNIFPSLAQKGYPSFRLRMCGHGTALLKIFLFTLPVTVAGQVFLLCFQLTEHPVLCAVSVVVAVLGESTVFWNGIISVYCTSVQLGIRERILGILFGYVFPLNLIFLGRIIRITDREIRDETEKESLNRERKGQKICETKYPILFVHGVFFRDSKYLNYWGRIPSELTRNGATIYYGNHPSAASVEESGRFLAERIKRLFRRRGAERSILSPIPKADWIAVMP